MKVNEIKESKLSIENTKLKERNLLLTSKISKLEKEIAQYDTEHEFTEKLLSEKIHKIPFTNPVIKKSGRVTAFVMLSDTHFDETIRQEEVLKLNKFDREIAVLRLQMFHDNLIKMMKRYLAGVVFDGLTLNLNGDILSGIIHDELKETNESPIIDSVLFWATQLSSVIASLSDKLGLPIYVPCIVGNHGRLSKGKPPNKEYVRQSFDYLIYKLIERDFAHDNKVTIDVSESTDKLIQIYSTRILLHHGQSFHGGSGISGLLTPIMLGNYRKTKRMQSVGMDYDYLALGHFHTYAAFYNVLMNGSLKGFDEFAFINNLPYEDPKQLFVIIDPEKKVTIQAPIFCKHPDEKWK